MAAPLRKGGALVRQRLAGVAFVVVISLLVAFAIALYRKEFTPVVEVDLRTDSLGNQLAVNGDVKVRGLIVGRITSVRSTGDGSTIGLALDEDMAPMVPAGTTARLVPKTLFGEKYVALVTPPAGGPAVRDGDVLEQDRSAEAIETEQVLDDLLPLLEALRPEDVSTTLNAVSGALRGRGERLGENAVLVRDYLAQINPELPRIQRDLVGLADLADTVDEAAPDLIAVLDDLSFSSRALQDQEGQFTRFLATSTTFSGSADSLLRQNEQRLVRLASESLAPLRLFERYAPQYGCFLRAIDDFQRIANDTIGGLQPGLRITLEVTQDQGGFVQDGPGVPGDEPLYEDDVDPTCYGLDERVVGDITVYREARDGYNDEAEAATPGVQNTKTGPGSEPNDMDGTPPPGSTRPVSARAQTDAVKLISSPVLGLPPSEVHDLAALWLGPVARGTTASYR